MALFNYLACSCYLKGVSSNSYFMTTWPHGLMFTKCFELLREKKKKNVFVGTVSYLPRYMNSSRFHPPAARAVPSLYARLDSPINPVFPASSSLLRHR